MDLLSQVLRQFNLHAEVFFKGNLCELSEFPEQATSNKGHLHMLKSGKLTVLGADNEKYLIEPGSILFFPQGRHHQLLPDPVEGADLVCANITYSGFGAHPIAASLPSILVLTTLENPKLSLISNWIFTEAFEYVLDEKHAMPTSKANNFVNGVDLIIDKLCEIFIIELVRSLSNKAYFDSGLLAAMSNRHIRAVISSVHEKPAYPWTVEKMASLASMSRAKFAIHFKQIMKLSPLEYVTEWRIRLAKESLIRGESVEMAARQVGYANASSLARVFKKHMGLTPREWLQLSVSHRRNP
jgi:AraC-like DNA-binding protein